eukprot:TRINITY_DN11661_c0_g1_i1.p2 TRINITY_DN11661_c0_g1~~TRINITY_DN11661_c0_g1_i1.p2  ORF type:complete len:113 (-),score=18.42 TRINITY_DN11661_c0_g1_i1:740-1078(-)
MILEIQSHLSDGRRGEILRDGVHVAIIGPPNVGKSTMLNTLARREAAIVSPISGTTRDVIEVKISLGGYPLIISDTAGIVSSTTDIIEKEGINRAKNRWLKKSRTIVLLIQD